MTLPLSDDTILGRLHRNAIEHGDEPAIHLYGRGDDDVTTLTWAGLLRHSDAYAQRYRATGVQPGDVVMVSLQHGMSMYPAYLGVMLAGAIPSFLAFPTPKQDPVLYWKSHQALFERLTPDAVLTYAANARDLAAVLPA
ncbi:MAG TPA: AMP-binding protein, partial [Jatrophihabitantaceae bacterium]|nr:AMP-binding protein [Jatrophihabitantaceae bacterium]